MYDSETRTAFIELRAQGWSIKRIATRLKLAPRTLVNWNRQDYENCTISASFLPHLPGLGSRNATLAAASA